MCLILRYLDSPMAKVFRPSSERNRESKLNQKCKLWVSLGKAPKKDHLMDAKLVQNTLKIYNLTATNAILMKLSTIRYLHETFNLAKD